MSNQILHPCAYELMIYIVVLHILPRIYLIPSSVFIKCLQLYIITMPWQAVSVSRTAHKNNLHIPSAIVLVFNHILYL